MLIATPSWESALQAYDEGNSDRHDCKGRGDEKIQL